MHGYESSPCCTIQEKGIGGKAKGCNENYEGLKDNSIVKRSTIGSTLFMVFCVTRVIVSLALFWGVC